MTTSNAVLHNCFHPHPLNGTALPLSSLTLTLIRKICKLPARPTLSRGRSASLFRRRNEGPLCRAASRGQCRTLRDPPWVIQGAFPQNVHAEHDSGELHQNAGNASFSGG